MARANSHEERRLAIFALLIHICRGVAAEQQFNDAVIPLFRGHMQGIELKLPVTIVDVRAIIQQLLDYLLCFF